MLWISVGSSLVFAFLGNWMARRRPANKVIWTGLGFLFPPALLVLKIWHWNPSSSANQGESQDDSADAP